MRRETTTVVTPGAGKKLQVLGDSVTVKTTGAETAGAWSLFEWDVPRDSGPPPHRHAWEEVYYVLDGTLDFMVDGQVVPAQPGCLVAMPGNAVHTYKVTSSTARLLMWATPAGVESFLEDLAREITSFPPDIPRVLEIAARHKVEPVLPAEAR